MERLGGEGGRMVPQNGAVGLGAAAAFPGRATVGVGGVVGAPSTLQLLVLSEEQGPRCQISVGLLWPLGRH